MNIFNAFANSLVHLVQTLDAALFHAHDSDPFSAPASLLEGAGNLILNVATGVFEVGDAMIGAAGGALLALDATQQNLAQIDAATRANLDALGHPGLEGLSPADAQALLADSGVGWGAPGIGPSMGLSPGMDHAMGLPPGMDSAMGSPPGMDHAMGLPPGMDPAMGSGFDPTSHGGFGASGMGGMPPGTF